VSGLTAPEAQRVLESIAAADRANRPAADARFRSAKPAGGSLSPQETAAIYRDAPLAVRPAVAEQLYVLALTPGVTRVVEFGMSFALSTIHLAAGLRDSGGGRLVTTELDAEKATYGQRNVVEAGLADLVEVRVGDARETLRELAEPIDLLFLDGLNDLYLPLLRALEPRLRRGALVAADRPQRPRYSSYVGDPGNGYASARLVGDLELSVRVG
jgi:predicted O-methyltransferase YrrM